MKDKKLTYFQKLAYIFAPADAKGVGFWDRFRLVGSMDAEDAWAARKDQPTEKFLIDMVAELSHKMGIKEPPPVFIYKSEVPNAVSLESGSVAVSSDILEIMTPGQVTAILGHELAHHRHRGRDLPILLGIPLAYDVISEVIRAQMWRNSGPNSKVAFATVHSVGLWGANVALPTAYMRQLEFEADKEGAWFTKRPEDMRGALEALERRGAELRGESETVKPEETQDRKWFLRTHPPTGARLQRLKQLEDRMRQDGLLEEKLPSEPISR